MKNINKNIVCELYEKTLRPLRLKQKIQRREHKEFAKEAKKNSL